MIVNRYDHINPSTYNMMKYPLYRYIINLDTIKEHIKKLSSYHLERLQPNNIKNITQNGGGKISYTNPKPPIGERTFYIYTTGMDFDKSFERWDMYIRDSIINILLDYDRVIIRHSDIFFSLPEDVKEKKKSAHEPYIKLDAMHPKVYSSTFIDQSIIFDKLDEIHGGKDYILFDFAHVIQYILPPSGEKYDNIVQTKLYGSSDESAPFYLNSVYIGVIGNEDIRAQTLEDDARNYIIRTGKVFSVREGIVTTYIKRLFENHNSLFEKNNLLIQYPNEIYEKVLALVKKQLEVEWRKKYGGLFNKIKLVKNGTEVEVDFDDIYKSLLASSRTPIVSIFNLYLEDTIYSQDVIYEKVLTKYKPDFGLCN